MRTIARNPKPPECLAAQPPGQDWSAFMQTACHRLVGDSLRIEQHHLCCYCESAITVQESHIEHMVPRSADPSQDYDYANLAASCDGGEVEHCGRFKDDRHQNPGYTYNRTLFCIPHDPSTYRLFSYLPNGDIIAAHALGTTEGQRANDMIQYLGLACARLSGRRRSHARCLISTLGPNPDAALVQWAAQYYLQPDQDGRLRSFNSLSRTILCSRPPG